MEREGKGRKMERREREGERKWAEGVEREGEGFGTGSPVG